MRNVGNGVYQEFRTARKPYQCWNALEHGWAEDPHTIQTGERHCHLVLMPSGGECEGPLKARECLKHCQHQQEAGR